MTSSTRLYTHALVLLLLTGAGMGTVAARADLGGTSHTEPARAVAHAPRVHLAAQHAVVAAHPVRHVRRHARPHTHARTHRHSTGTSVAAAGTVTKPVTAPAPAVHHTAAAAPAAHHTAPKAPSGPTDWSTLNTAIARLPGYHAGDAKWVVEAHGSHWATANWYTGVIYISRTVPDSYVYSVAVHEWSHLVSVADYGGDVTAAVAAMHSYFGGAGLLGAERAADCMARLQGATFTAYTSCTDPTWREGARRLINGKKLPS
jgi:hypothetical protein